MYAILRGVAILAPKLEVRVGAGRRKLLPRPLESDARRFEGLGCSAAVLAGIAARVEAASMGRLVGTETDMADPHVTEVDVPALAVPILVATSGEFGHRAIFIGHQPRAARVRPWRG